MNFSLITILFVIPILLFLPVNVAFSQLEEEPVDGFWETCPECNGGGVYHHNHWIAVYCTVLEGSQYQTGEMRESIENVGEPATQTTGLGTSETELSSGNHYHHKHYYCY